MYIFGEPSRVPVIFVERVINAPRRTASDKSYFNHLDLNSLTGPASEPVKQFSGSSPQEKRRVLKVAVFVHGFQVSHSFDASGSPIPF